MSDPVMVDELALATRGYISGAEVIERIVREIYYQYICIPVTPPQLVEVVEYPLAVPAAAAARAPVEMPSEFVEDVLSTPSAGATVPEGLGVFFIEEIGH